MASRSDESKYNGWTNRATWNVAMWLRDDFDSVLESIAEDRKINCGVSFREAIEFHIEQLELRCWYLPGVDGRPRHFMTPDAELFENADWDELYEDLIKGERDEREEEER